MTEPLLRRLQARGERLTVGALPWVAPVYRAMPQVAEVIEFPFAHGGLQWGPRWAIAKRIRGRFERAYVMPNSMKSALLPLMAGIPRRIGYVGEARFGLLTHRTANPKSRPPMVAFYSALSGQADVHADHPRLEISAAQVDETLQGLGLQAAEFYVFAPGAEYGPAKRWPADRFSELAKRLELPVVLLGSGKEDGLCDQIATSANRAQASKCINLAGKTSLLQAFSLIAASKATISNDSGLMHVAAALGVRQVAIFGSSSPLHTPPLNERASVIWLKTDSLYQPPLDCSPCFQRQCPLGHTRCLNDITAERVLQEI